MAVKDMVEEAKDEMEDAKEKRARGGRFDGATEHKVSLPSRQKRARGGNIKGGSPFGRPDKRARGGATSDLNPTTAAGKMSTPDYEHEGTVTNGAMSKGGDTKGKNG